MRQKLIIFSLVGAMAFMAGFAIDAFNDYQGQLAAWKYAARSCAAVTRAQSKIIKELLK